MITLWLETGLAPRLTEDAEPKQRGGGDGPAARRPTSNHRRWEHPPTAVTGCTQLSFVPDSRGQSHLCEQGDREGFHPLCGMR